MAQRLAPLDGLRGVAAFSVFVYHALGFAPDASPLGVMRSSPWAVLWDGAAAVDLFFVLSGFVLALPYLQSGQSPAYVAYATRRVFRIFPAFLVAVALSVAMRMAHHPHGLEAFSAWASVQWQEPLTPFLLLRTCTLFFLADVRPSNPVFWSLVVEIRMSLLLPLLVLALQKGRSFLSDASLLAVTLVLANTWSWLAYLPLFAMGALAAKHVASWFALTASVPRWALFVFLVCGVALYGHRALMPNLVQQQAHVVSAVGSSLLIFCAIRFSSLSGVLCSPLFGFMGQTSYGFYLLHLPLLLLLFSWSPRSAEALVLCVLMALALGYLFAWLIYRYVERPANDWGRALSAKLA
jgi:peptidoglycan/LPS O-acetylase OafA/YrhL